MAQQMEQEYKELNTKDYYPQLHIKILVFQNTKNIG